VLDWKPETTFSDDTLLYASYSRGYKSGGINPPFNPLLFTAPDVYKPEVINAFEIGTKNTFLDGTLRANITGFYNDYKDPQISRIINRTSFNDNTNASIYGIEGEFIVNPTPPLVFNINASYLKTKVKGLTLVDTRDPSKVYGLDMPGQIAPGANNNVGVVIAISAETGKTLWKHEQRAGMLSLVATGGGLVFGGDANGRFRAFDDRTGKVMWETNLGAPVSGFPISFAVGGKQYVAVSTGGSLVANSTLRMTPELKPGTTVQVYVFALPVVLGRTTFKRYYEKLGAPRYYVAAFRVGTMLLGINRTTLRTKLRKLGIPLDKVVTDPRAGTPD